MANKLTFVVVVALALIVVATYASAQEDAQRAGKSRRPFRTTSTPASNFTTSPKRNRTSSAWNCSRADICQRVRILRKDVKSLKSEVAQLKKANAKLNSASFNLECDYVRSQDDSATCKAGWTALSCSCSGGCGSFEILNSRTCKCDSAQCKKVRWAAANCCRTVKSGGR